MSCRDRGPGAVGATRAPDQLRHSLTVPLAGFPLQVSLAASVKWENTCPSSGEHTGPGTDLAEPREITDIQLSNGQQLIAIKLAPLKCAAEWVLVSIWSCIITFDCSSY